VTNPYGSATKSFTHVLNACNESLLGSASTAIDHLGGMDERYARRVLQDENKRAGPLVQRDLRLTTFNPGSDIPRPSCRKALLTRTELRLRHHSTNPHDRPHLNTSLGVAKHRSSERGQGRDALTSLYDNQRVEDEL